MRNFVSASCMKCDGPVTGSGTSSGPRRQHIYQGLQGNGAFKNYVYKILTFFDYSGVPNKRVVPDKRVDTR